MKQGYLVGELADFFGISRDTLRLYDKLGIISPKKNEHNNYRCYSREELICLVYVMELRKINLPLEDIRMLMNESSIENAAKVMAVQEQLIEEKLKELKRLKSTVWDYKMSFTHAATGLNKIHITESPIFIYKDVEESLINTLESFNSLTEYHIPKFTFIVPQELFLSERIITSENACKKEFTYAVTLKDDGKLTESKTFPKDKFKVIHYEKCIYTVMKFYTNQDYSDIVNLREYVTSNGFLVVGDVMLRVISIKNSSELNIDYYETWVPIA
ncbi:MAG: MerR family transcriptional regulator [Aminipila sp.]